MILTLAPTESKNSSQGQPESINFLRILNYQNCAMGIQRPATLFFLAFPFPFSCSCSRFRSRFFLFPFPSEPHQFLNVPDSSTSDHFLADANLTSLCRQVNRLNELWVVADTLPQYQKPIGFWIHERIRRRSIAIDSSHQETSTRLRV